jgi:Carboxypeptidase regulatory-like domain
MNVKPGVNVKLGVAAWLVALLFTCALIAQNDDTGTRSVQGVVTDASGQAVAGAVVQLKDTKSLQIRSYRTEADGAYHFAGLSANVEYELEAKHDNATSGKKTLTVFNTQKIATVNLKLK